MFDSLEERLDLVDRHFHILKQVVENQPIGIVRLSRTTGYEKHQARRSLKTLQDADLIEPTDHGAVTTDRTREFLATYEGRLADLIERLNAISQLRFDEAEKTKPPGY